MFLIGEYVKNGQTRQPGRQKDVYVLKTLKMLEQYPLVLRSFGVK